MELGPEEVTVMPSRPNAGQRRLPAEDDFPGRGSAQKNSDLRNVDRVWEVDKQPNIEHRPGSAPACKGSARSILCKAKTIHGLMMTALFVQ